MSSSQSNPGFSQQESHAPPGGAGPGSAKPRDTSMARNIVGVLCPYCASVSADIRRCNACGGHFDPLSRQATQNDMGPWFLFDKDHPTRPGCSYEKIRELAASGKIRPGTIIRGPTTKQFWSFASRAPSIANLVGYCHNCQGKAGTEDYSCKACGSVFSPETDRQHLGLAPVRLLPGRDSPAVIAAREFSPRELGPEPAVLDAPDNPRVLEAKPAPTEAKRPAPSVEPKPTRPLPGASFLPPTPEELAELARVSPPPIAPHAKTEIAVPMAKTPASVLPAKARPAPAPATNASTAWDLGSLDHDRGSGGAWWWVAAVAMLALGGGIAYIAWSQSNPGRRYLSTPATVAKGTPATSGTAKNDQGGPPATESPPAPPEPAPLDPVGGNVKPQDASDKNVREHGVSIAPSIDPPVPPPHSSGSEPSKPPFSSGPVSALTSPPESQTQAVSPPKPVGPTPAVEEKPNADETAVVPDVKPEGETSPVNATPPVPQASAPEALSRSDSTNTPRREPPPEVPGQTEATAPATTPGHTPTATPTPTPTSDPKEPPGVSVSLLDVRREVLAALERESTTPSGPDAGTLLGAWDGRADNDASRWLAKVRATLERWQVSDRIGRSLP